MSSFKESNFLELRLSLQTLILFAPISVAAVPLAYAETMTIEIFIDSLFVGLIATSLTSSLRAWVRSDSGEKPFWR
jgi:hypothetical protein